MTPDELIQRARDAAQLEHFDSESFREGLGLALQASNGHRLRTEQGKTLLHDFLMSHLVARLKVADYLRRNAHVLRERIERPTFILGMPRTGSTLLSNLLENDPARRTPLRWEVQDPVPPATTQTLKTDPRCLARIEAEKAKPKPVNAHVHLEPWDSATECHHILSHDYKSGGIEAVLGDLAFGDWLHGCDALSAYTYHKKFLQLLQSNAPGTWNLKLPTHALNIPAILAVYPDARFIWTHRNPYQVAGSLMDALAIAHTITMSEPDLGYIKHYAPVRLHELAARPMAIMAEMGYDPFHHIFYDDLVRDPIGEMRNLYRALGDELSPDTEARMQNWLKENPQHKHGAHKYSLEKFGLTENQLRPYLEDYIQRFDLQDRV